MQNSKLVIAVLLLIGLFVTGYQCSSTELTSARLYIQQKNYDKAIEVLNQDIAKNPKSDEGYFLLGVAYGEKENMPMLVESFDKSLSISNKFAKEIGEYKASYWSNYFNRAVNDYKKGTGTEDDDSVHIYLDNAIENYNTAILLAPDTADNYRNLAYVYLTILEYENAVEPLEKLVKLDKSNDGYQYLGEVYYTLGSTKMGDYKTSSNAQDSVEAITLFNKAITVLTEGKNLYPENSQISATLTQSYIGAGRIDEALKEAEVSVKSDPSNKDYKYNYGVLLLNMERFAEAETQFKDA
ncbi:MAG TPA: tetratricopeptide repeat protein, partial [Ignavibacteriaceae bacterium]